jgi:hypothetical protein
METFVSQFKVITVSSNTNSFGLHGVIMADKSGLAFEVGMNYLSKPNTGDMLNVTLTKSLKLSSIAGKSYEIPRKLPNVPAKLLTELFPTTK